jgi:hypothetical protein
LVLEQPFNKGNHNHNNLTKPYIMLIQYLQRVCDVYVGSLIDSYQNGEFWALKSSYQESFRALQFSLRVFDFMVRKFSNLESFRVRRSSIWVLRFKGPKIHQSGEC